MKTKKSSKGRFFTSITLLLLIALVILNSKYEIINLNCNMRKDHDSISDKHYKGIMAKIEELEKKEPKDDLTKKRLVQQYNIIGIHFLNKKIFDSAVESFSNSIKYGNKTADAYYSLGLAYAGRSDNGKSLSDVKDAEQNYRKAISLNDRLYDAKYGLAVLLFYHKDNGQDEAVRLINDIVSRNAAHYPARFANGRFQYELGNKEKALAIYQQLSADIDKLPPSGISNDYKTQCNNNIIRIKSELSIK